MMNVLLGANLQRLQPHTSQDGEKFVCISSQAHWSSYLSLGKPQKISTMYCNFFKRTSYNTFFITDIFIIDIFIIDIFCNHNPDRHHQDVLKSRIPLTLCSHPSLSVIALGKSKFARRFARWEVSGRIGTVL